MITNGTQKWNTISVRSRLMFSTFTLSTVVGRRAVKRPSVNLMFLYLVLNGEEKLLCS